MLEVKGLKRGGGELPKKDGYGLCGPFPKILTLFMAKTAEKSYSLGSYISRCGRNKEVTPWALLQDLIFKANCSLFSFVLEFANQVPDTEISSTNLNTASVAMNDDTTAGGENADRTTEEL